MKSRLTCMMLILVSVLVLDAAPTRFTPNPVSPRKIVIGKEPVITLCKNGKAEFEVVKPTNPGAVRAAKELIARMEQITGKKAAMVEKASGKVPVFYLGACPEAAKLGLDPEKLDLDGYYIKTDGNRIFITGDSTRNRQGFAQATMFGVYDFLERFAGMRYYFPGEFGTIVPKLKNWTIPAIDITERPDTQFRWTYMRHYALLGGKDEYSKLGDYQLLLRDSTLKNVACNHGLNSLELSKRFAGTHPEFFAMSATGERLTGDKNATNSRRHGHLCFSSEGLKEEIYQDAAACLTGKPASSRGLARWISTWNTQSVDLMPNDGMQWCLCPKCKAVQAQGKQAMSDHIWKFTCDIANRLKKNGIQGYVKQNVYTNAELVPTFPIPDNVMIGVCVTGPWAMSNDKLRERDAKKIRDWSRAAHGKIRLWTYQTKAGIPLPVVPNFTPRAVGGFYKAQKERIFGSFFEAGGDRWVCDILNGYVFSKVMWDWNTDVEKLLNDHCRRMYGPAAPQMDKFYRELENIWMKQVLRELVQTPYGDDWKLPTRRELYTKIFSPAKIKEINDLLDEAEKAVARSPQCLSRVKFMRKELWQPVVDEAIKFQTEASNRTAWTLYAAEAGTVTLDGKLDEAEWKKAEPVWLAANHPRQKVEVQTRVRMLQDKDNFYFGFEADEPETEQMAASTNREPDDTEIWRDNGGEIFLSAGPASEFIYQFIFNSAGAKSDLKNSLFNVDPKYESGFEVKTDTVSAKMWTAEVRIPRKAMPELADRTGIVGNFTRHRVLKNKKVGTEFYAWFPKKRNIPEDCGIIRLDAQKSDDNLIRLPDFNRNPKASKVYSDGNWTVNHQGKAIIADNEFFVTKGVSLRMEPGIRTVSQYRLRIKPDTQYKLSFFVRTEKLEPGLRVLLRTGTTQYLLGSWKDLIRDTVDWYRVEKVFRTPKKFQTEVKYMPFLEFNTGKSTGKCWIDHVELTEVK